MKLFAQSGNPDHIAYGKTLLSQGKVGLIVLAGGDGSRLDWHGPKGTFPICPLTQKSLFDLLCDKLEDGKQLYGNAMPAAMMVSPFNEKATKEALGNRGKSLFSFYVQQTAPLLGEDKLPCGGESPRGNGEALKEWITSGIYEKWKQEGVQYLYIIPIDNPLVDPFDPNLCGFHALKRADITLKAVLRDNKEEQVGVIEQKEGKIRIIEYSESPPEEAIAINTGLFCLSMPFAGRGATWSLPLHFARKKKEGTWVYKQEYFLFDILEYAKVAEVLIYPRKNIFAPLKTAKDIPGIQKALASILS